MSGRHIADPALRSGRTAWRRIHHVYARFAACSSMRFCSEMRGYVRSDVRRTRAEESSISPSNASAREIGGRHGMGTASASNPTDCNDLTLERNNVA